VLMSRWVTLFFLSPIFTISPALAQNAPKDSAAELIAKSKELTALDKNGCLISKEKDVITVCGEGGDNESQRVFGDRPSDEDRIRRGEAVSTTRAAACIPGTGCKPPLYGGTPFGRVPPPAIPFDEVMKGLPEPDMVVPEGSGDNPAPPQ
jgi:hypothetical protein